MKIETIEQARSIRREIFYKVEEAWRVASCPLQFLRMGVLASRAAEVVKHDRFLKTGRTYR